MVQPMSFQEFGNLLKYIANNNSPFRHTTPHTPCIKYVDPHFDMRTNSCFSMTLRTMGAGEHVFHTQNECRDLPTSLYDRVMAFLTTQVSIQP
jgi:hypothetical protein